jgi:TetR/AcrR family transcriptional regulator, transcriptional repressor for nem operon
VEIRRRKGHSGSLGCKGRKTRQEIVRRAAPLFNRQGFAGTSMSDLMKATNLQKGGLYRYFPSKEALAREAFDYTWERAVSERLDGLDRVTGAIPRLKAMIDNFVEKRAHLVPGGCPLLNTAIESDDGNPALRARARKALASWTNRLAAIVSEGVQTRELQTSVNPCELADTMVATLEGALMMSRLRQSEAPLHAARKHLVAALETLKPLA